MNVNSGGLHILLFERDQQLTTLLSGELALAGYEIHTARTAVEVFDTIARFPVRLVMVNLAQAQAGRREFWVALDGQRRGRGVQVFTYRCANLAGYGPDDPEERVEMVLTDLEVDGMLGVVKLVDAVRARVPGSNSTATSASPRPAPAAYIQEMPQERGSALPVEMPASPLAAPVYPAAQMTAAPSMANGQPLQGTLRPQPPQEMPAPTRPAEPARSGHSTFTDKIRAVIYPSSRNVAPAPEATLPPNNPGVQPQSAVPYQNSEIQPRPQVSQRFAEAERASSIYREDMPYQPPINSHVSAQSNQMYTVSGAHPTNEESGLDQLSRMLRGDQRLPQNTLANGNMQNSGSYAAPGLEIDQQEIQEFRNQILQAARMDEAYERSSIPQPRSADPGILRAQLRPSPIQDAPFEREAEYRRATSGPLPPSPENYARPAMTVLQPTQAIPPVQPAQPQAYQASPAQNYQSQAYQASPAQSYQSQAYQASPAQNYQPQGNQASPAQSYQSQASQVQSAQNYQPQSGYSPSAGASSPVRPASLTREVPFEAPISAASNSQIRPQEASQGIVGRQTSGPLSIDEASMLSEQVQVNLHQRRHELKTSDDMLLDIVKSLPPMTTPPEPPQVLSGRATRTLGSVLLEGHLVPQERLQVAQHVQRMMSGVDLNYQLGEILLMFKLLTPDQLLAASLVSYGMISTVQISALGRIRQELYAMGLEYDLESLVILFRILTPEQMREVRASWSS